MVKLLFFDVDGTLVDFAGEISPSTIEALKRAKKIGHKIFICSGRSLGQIPEYLIEQIGFDGIVGASGAYVECEGKEIFHHCMPREDVERVLCFFKEQDLIYSCQSKRNIIMEPAIKERYMELILKKKWFKEEQLKETPLFMEDNLNIYDNLDQIEKMLYHECKISVADVNRILGNTIKVTMSSFEKPDDTSGEITSAGINKAFGMQKVLEYYGLNREDCVAFGDGPNDIEMIQFAGIGVAMGNSLELVKKEADMVTDDVRNDGILHAMEKLALI